MNLINQKDRLQRHQHSACVLWLTGLSGAGKSTIANLVEQRLFNSGFHTYLLDGDALRTGLCRDLGFSVADRHENIRRIGEAAKLLADAGMIVIAATISPFQQMRTDMRQLFSPGEFIEIFIDTPLAVCEQRDPKGLYRKARSGEVKEFTGIHSAYEAPSAPDIHLQTTTTTPEANADKIIAYLQQHNYLIKTTN